MRLVVRWELTRSVSLPSEAHVEAGSSLPAGGVFEEGGGGGVAGAQAGRRVPGQGGQVRWTLLWVPQGFMCEVQVLCVST